MQQEKTAIMLDNGKPFVPLADVGQGGNCFYQGASLSKNHVSGEKEDWREFKHVVLGCAPDVPVNVRRTMLEVWRVEEEAGDESPGKKFSNLPSMRVHHEMEVTGKNRHKCFL